MSRQENTSIVLYGLPGCGKRLLVEQWRKEGGLNVKAVDFADLPVAADKGFRCLVIDSRSFWQAPRDNWLQEEMRALIAMADGIVLSFLEASELNVQMNWKRWLKASAADKPLFMSLNRAVPQGLSALLEKEAEGETEVLSYSTGSSLQVMEFELGRVSLDHLLMVLDNAKTALGMKLIRARGVVQTVEYENLVMIEGAAYRWDTYAATEQEAAQWQNRLQLQGFEMDSQWLQQMLYACKQ